MSLDHNNFGTWLIYDPNEECETCSLFSLQLKLLMGHLFYQLVTFIYYTEAKYVPLLATAA